MSIEFNAAIDNPALPMGGPLAPTIEAFASLHGWFQANPAYLAQESGKIASWISRGSKAPTLTQGNTARRATLVANKINTYEGAQFTPADPDFYTLTTLQDLTQPFSWIYAGQMPGGATTHNLMGSFTSSLIRAILNYTANAASLAFQFGTSQVNLPIANNQAGCVIVSYDGAKIKGMSAGVRLPDITAAGTPGSVAFQLGALNSAGAQPASEWMSDLILLNEDIFSVGAVDRLAAVRNYIANSYNILA